MEERTAVRSRAAAASLALCAVVLIAGCYDVRDPPPPYTGTLSGLVAISGPVRGAVVTIEQLDLTSGEVLVRLASDVLTDSDGRFGPFETENLNGIFRIRARGGRYTDLVTGAIVELDDDDEMRSLLWFPLLGLRDDALVSPVGHLVEARTMANFARLGNLRAAMDEATAHLHAHFGDVEWGLTTIDGLDRPANSPTEPIRAALVHAALSVLVADIAADAGAGPQEVNVHGLTKRWADDIQVGEFDGNDGNDRAPGSGLQLGFCPPVEPGCVVPENGCALGSCRRLCDLYAGTPRALLAGAMAKVIRDPAINKTGLDLPNVLSVVRAVSDNADAALFGRGCIETLDRLAPTLRFEAPTPGAGLFVRGAIAVRVTAVDDTDPKPRASVIGFPDTDGDPTNAAALAMIDTTTRADGSFTVAARASDQAGNVVTASRTFTIDNTPPVLALASAGFFVDGVTWWTAAAAPVLTGTVSDGAPVSVKAVVPGGLEVAGQVTGTAWTITFPAGALDASGPVVTVVATDAAGNQGIATQRIRPDLEAPALSFQTSTVIDEAAEVVTFGVTDHAPTHAHTGAPIDLSAQSSCPSPTKFSYLLRSTGPAYAIETPGRNPLQYQLIAADPGVGISAGATRYRVGRRVGPATTWVLDWTSTGVGVPVSQGVTRFPVGIFADVVAGLASMEGIYDVQFRSTDRLSRVTTVARCFDLKLRAPPLEFEAPGAKPTKAHKYALDSLSLAPGAPFDEIAARLLNNDATGASLIDQDVFNATTETVYLTVTVTRPALVTSSQSFQLRNAMTAIVPATCGDDCPVPEMLGPVYFSPSPATTTPETQLDFPAKVFEVVGGVPTTEIPCLAPCAPSGNVFKFAIPPRANSQPPRLFRVMTMIGRVPGLWPRNAMHPSLPPFADEVLTWSSNGYPTMTTTRFTGIVDRTPVPARTGCVAYVGNPDVGFVCQYLSTLVPYRALRTASLVFASDTLTDYGTAASGSLPARLVVPTRLRADEPANNWSTSEGALP